MIEEEDEKFMVDMIDVIFLFLFFSFVGWTLFLFFSFLFFSKFRIFFENIMRENIYYEFLFLCAENKFIW